ncbi:hypothetical protein I552_6874 [Mycobacterium xenopi 3993]|nr:hypothetical protein I552_6874 [Mycobacterium xenopi 3993]
MLLDSCCGPTWFHAGRRADDAIGSQMECCSPTAGPGRARAYLGRVIGSAAAALTGMLLAARCWPRSTTPRWSHTESASRSDRWCSRWR